MTQDPHRPSEPSHAIDCDPRKSFFGQTELPVSPTQSRKQTPGFSSIVGSYRRTWILRLRMALSMGDADGREFTSDSSVEKI